MNKWSGSATVRLLIILVRPRFRLRRDLGNVGTGGSLTDTDVQPHESDSCDASIRSLAMAIEVVSMTGRIDYMR